MNAEETIRELHKVESEHKNDKVLTFGIRIADMARDCANTIEELQAEVASLTAQLAEARKWEKAVVEDMQYYLENNEEYGVVFIPKFAVKKITNWRGPQKGEGK